LGERTFGVTTDTTSEIRPLRTFDRQRFMSTAAAGLALYLESSDAAAARVSQPVLGDEGPMPDLGGDYRPQQFRSANDKERFMPEPIAWLNSDPLSTPSLRGKVVLVDFWTYSCINSLRNLPYIKGWAAKYKDAGLVVIGVHTPEFSFEKVRPNVQSAVRALKVTYPVPIDSNYRIWQSFKNEYWPADYFVDRRGRIRHHHFGEGDYAESERVIQTLLNDPRSSGDASAPRILGTGIEAPPSVEIASPETYVGYRRAERFTSPEQVAQDTARVYGAPARTSLNEWGLSGSWNVGAESGVLGPAPGSVVFRFHARDLNFVLAPPQDGAKVRFAVTLDGAAPGRDAGVDVAPDGTGTVSEPRLYQLVRQQGGTRDRTFAIEFRDPGVHAYVFTFG
jgi:thiol-disulfide isomerase/thioredoxin